MKAILHVRAVHTDLYIKFEKTTAGILEPLDLLSVPEDMLSSLMGGRNTEKILSHIQDLRKEAEFQTE